MLIAAPSDLMVVPGGACRLVMDFTAGANVAFVARRHGAVSA